MHAERERGDGEEGRRSRGPQEGAQVSMCAVRAAPRRRSPPRAIAAARLSVARRQSPPAAPPLPFARRLPPPLQLLGPFPELLLHPRPRSCALTRPARPPSRRLGDGQQPMVELPEAGAGYDDPAAARGRRRDGGAESSTSRRCRSASTSTRMAVPTLLQGLSALVKERPPNVEYSPPSCCRTTPTMPRRLPPELTAGRWKIGGTCGRLARGWRG